MDSSFCLLQWSVLLLSLTIAHYIIRLPFWVELHLEIKKRNVFFFCEYTTLSYLSYWTGLRRRRGLNWGQTPASGSQSFTFHLYLCVCLCERVCVCGCSEQDVIKKHRFCRHRRQTRFSSTLDIICIKMWHCHFFLRKFSQKILLKIFLCIFTK